MTATPLRPAVSDLADFEAAGVLALPDRRVAERLAELAGEPRHECRLALALAVRAVRLQHVCVDLATVAVSVAPAEDADAADVGAAGTDGPALAWPDPATWAEVVAASPLATTDEAWTLPPLHVVGTRAYLRRYWDLEQELARDLHRLAAHEAGSPAEEARLDALFGAPERGLVDRQRRAAATAAERRLTVIAGGPGTGKTRTIARLLALLHEPGAPRRRVALAAPTGKAADRMAEAVRQQVADPQVAALAGPGLAELAASTIHALLGTVPGDPTRFRHHRHHPLPHDLVVVDEASMVSLPLMARLVAALGPTARLVLVGDPDQLASVEAGAVLGDVVRAGRLGALGPSVVELTVAHRFAEGSPIAELARAIRHGDAAATLAALQAPPALTGWVRLVEHPDPLADPDAAGLRALVTGAARRVTDAAVAGDAARALAHRRSLQVLCGHRHGPHGVSGWNAAVERWLRAEGLALRGTWYEGRPVLVTRNDARNRLRNGEVGVVGAHGGTAAVAFESADGLRWVPPARLDDVETAFALTIHKSQGSEYDEVVVVLPPVGSPLLTRELLYTAVTRATTGVTVVGTAAAVRAAVATPVSRASGLCGAPVALGP